MNDDDKLNDEQVSRRSFVKKAVYVPPAVFTLKVAPAYAKFGSEKGSVDWNDAKDVKKDKGGKG